MKFGLFEGQISNGRALAMAKAIFPTIFKIWTFYFEFQMFFDKMLAISPDFKLLGLRISDPIQNPDHL